MNKSLEDKKIAIVCDWITDLGGAELVLFQLMNIFPNADIFTSVFFPKDHTKFKGKNITTSFIQKIPVLRKSHKLALILRPMAFESFDLSGYDIVISSSSAESKGIITKPETLHVCYCHTPIRYFWSHYHEYLNFGEFGILNYFQKKMMPKIVHKLRQLDYIAAQRPDVFVANSYNTQKRIQKYYVRESSVIHPCIDSKEYIFDTNKEDYFLAVGRCIPYKKFDLIVDTFNENGKKIVIVTNTNNKLYKELKLKSKENIIWKLNITRNETKILFSKAKAFLFPQEEDFGLVPIEAMVSGTPVIAYNKGGSLETIINLKTGLFFEEQTVKSLLEAVKKIETINFNAKDIKKYSMKWDKEKFKIEIIDLINKSL